MANRQGFHGDGGMFDSNMNDPVFEPSPDFNFEDEPCQLMMGEDFNSQGDFPLFDMNMHQAFSGNMPMQHQGGWQNQMQQQSFQANQSLPRSMQEAIVDSRSDSVTQLFGQVTPPETDSASKGDSGQSQVHDSDAAKRKERARNAANKRHAKSKKPRTGSESAGAEPEVTEERGERQAHYREKNRVAAAKCRAKKKSHNDNLEEMHRDESSKNKILKAELMGLRNELAQLKGLTLEHSPDNCRCHGIHEYSMRQANLIARGVGPQYGPSMPSPAQESVQSVEAPISEVSVDGLFAGQDQMSPDINGLSRTQSTFAQGGWMQQP